MKIQFVNKLIEEGKFTYEIIYYLECLHVSERIGYLFNYLLKNNVRQRVFKSILDESKSEEDIDQLYQLLLSKLEVEDYRTRIIAASYLRDLAIEFEAKYFSKIMVILVNNRSILIRRKVYKLLDETNYAVLQQELLKVWDLYEDKELTKLIVYFFSVEFLDSHYNRILSLIEEDWLISKLFVRLTKHNAQKYLAEIRRIDIISYCYVSAKNGFSIENEDSIRIVKEYYNDEKFGLVLWSFGKLKNWDALVCYEDMISHGA